MSADQGQVTHLLEELVAWHRFANRESVVRLLKEVMNERHLAIFEALDGKTSQSDVANRAGVTRQAISLLVQKWKRLGLVMERDGMSVHIVRPSDLGIDVAPLTTRKVKEANGSNPTVS